MKESIDANRFHNFEDIIKIIKVFISESLQISSVCFLQEVNM